MFAKLFAISVFAILAAAIPAPNDTPAGGESCSTGSIQCCQSVQDANSTAIAPILGALGVDLQDITGLIGLTCSSINVVGVGSGNAW